MNIKKKKVSEMPLLEAVTDETIVHVVDNGVNYKIEANKLSNALPAGTVIDPNYVHTDNNYTTADKAKVAGAIQTETDPTVPAWAKEPTKPTYTASEVGAEPIKGSDDNYVTDLEKTKLSNLSGTNTGDQDLSGLSPIGHTHPHTTLLDKNAEPSFQHLDTTTEKTTPIDADSFGLWDSVTSTFKRLSVANMLTWFRGLPHTFSQLITFSGGVKSPTYQDLKGNNPFVTQNGGTIYHTIPWINTGTVNIVAGANTFSGSGTSFTTAMVGAKLIVNGEERIIASVSGQNGTIGGLWNESFIGSFLVFSISAKVLNGSIDFLNAYTGASIATISNGAVESKTNHYFYSQVNISDTINIKGGNPFNVTDLSLKRNSAGILEINNGTAGQFRDLKLRSVQVSDNTAAASIDKVGTTRYRADANNSYTEMCMQTGASTYAWVVIKQNTWS